jgi:hypothetical protein
MGFIILFLNLDWMFQVISGLNNFNAKSVESIVKAANKGGMLYMLISLLARSLSGKCFRSCR